MKLTQQIRLLVIRQQSATPNELVRILAAKGFTDAKLSTVQTIRADTLATLEMLDHARVEAQAAQAPAPSVAPRSPKPKKKPKAASRGARWAQAASEAQAARDALVTALETMDELRQEYEDWKDNLPENLASSALGEKLQTVAGFDIQSLISSLDEVDEWADAELPLGFGRD